MSAITVVPHSQSSQAIQRVVPAAMLYGNLALDITWPKRPIYIASAQVPREPTSIEIGEILKTDLDRRMLKPNLFIHSISWTGSLEFPRSYVDWIEDLPSEKFILMRYIPVMYERGEGGEWIASFLEANIHVSENDKSSSRAALRDHINGTFDILLREKNNLAPVAEKQLAVLMSYIRIA